ncbi:MAG: hypothetical protein RMN51_04870 [Verrucomicrobiota bacterium]|nr:hypothetical protein [Limisphaera sp.]MDW8381425.1 hypothetical protein [Verrucomicrobiota bacterium]
MVYPELRLEGSKSALPRARGWVCWLRREGAADMDRLKAGEDTGAAHVMDSGFYLGPKSGNPCAYDSATQSEVPVGSFPDPDGPLDGPVI